MLWAFLCDITPREARGLVITTYRSTAITISVIILQIPNSAPQKAYNSQPGERGSGEDEQIRLLTEAIGINAFSGSSTDSYLTKAGSTAADCVLNLELSFINSFG